MQPLIEVNNLTKTFKNFTAVNHLSFNVYRGDIYGFLGQNGAGKSTTMRMLLTLIQPTAGTINFFGLPLHDNSNAILAKVGAVIEKPDVYKYLSAYDNLQLFAKLSNCKPTKKELLQQLALVGLEQRAYDKVKTFSQGMKQRLGIAIALIHNPEIIILDEPTNGLDPQGIADIRNLILQLKQEQHKTIIVSSHLLSEVEQVATRVLIIDKGKKIIEDTAANLFDPSQTIVEIQTLNNAITLEKLQHSQWQQHIQTFNGNSLKLKLHYNQIPTLHKSLCEMNIDVVSLQPRHNLEDYFLQVTAPNQHVNTTANRTL
jgi:ABC-type multidrug transport system ATPase subunit